MKTYLALFLFLFLFVINSHAQKLYVQLSGGYAISTSSDDLGSPFSEIGGFDFSQDDNGNFTANPVYGTLGKGYKVNFGVGFLLNQSLGFELQATYAKSPRIKLAETNTPTYKAIHEVVTQRLVAVPQIVFSSSGEKLRWYNKTGIILPITGDSKSYAVIDDDEGRLAKERLGLDIEGAMTDVTIEGISTARFNPGFRNTLGLEYALTNRIGLNAEVAYSFLVIRIKQSEITDYAQQTNVGNLTLLDETLEDLPLSDKQTYYSDELTQNSNNIDLSPDTFDTTKASDVLEFKNNYNNLTFQLGLSFTF